MSEYKEFELKSVNKKTTNSNIGKDIYIEVLNEKGKSVLIPKNNIVITELDDTKSEILIPNICKIEVNLSKYDLHNKLNFEQPNQYNIIDLKDYCNKLDIEDNLSNDFNKSSSKLDNNEVLIHTFISSPIQNSNNLNKPFTFSSSEILLNKVENRKKKGDKNEYCYILLRNRRGSFNNTQNGFLIKMTKENLFEKINQAIIDGKKEINILEDTKIGNKFSNIDNTEVQVFGRKTLSIKSKYLSYPFNSKLISNSSPNKRDLEKTNLTVNYIGEIIIDMKHEDFCNKLNQALLDGKELDLREETKFKHPNLQNNKAKFVKL